MFPPYVCFISFLNGDDRSDEILAYRHVENQNLIDDFWNPYFVFSKALESDS